MIARHGTEEQKQRLLPDLASGKRRTGIALTEAGAGSDLQGITTRAERDGDEYVVRGTKMWITNARYADPLPVLVKTNPAAEPRWSGMSVLLVDGDTPGLTVSRDLGKLGYKGPETCEVVLDDCRVPAANLLGGEEGHGFKQVLSALEIGRVNIAARAVGVAAEALGAVAAVRARARGVRQSDRSVPGDSAEAGGHGYRRTGGAAADVVGGVDGRPRRRADTESGMAKLFASEVAIKASLEAMRIHGAYGYSTEADIERLYRDAPLMAIGEGTSDILRTIIAKAILHNG